MIASHSCKKITLNSLAGRLEKTDGTLEALISMTYAISAGDAMGSWPPHGACLNGQGRARITQSGQSGATGKWPEMWLL